VLRAAVGSKCALVEKKWQISARQNNAKAVKPSGKRTVQVNGKPEYKPGSESYQLDTLDENKRAFDIQFGANLPESILALSAIAYGYTMACESIGPTSIDESKLKHAQDLNVLCNEFLVEFHIRKESNYQLAVDNDMLLLGKLEKIIELVAQMKWTDSQVIIRHIVFMQHRLSEEAKFDTVNFYKNLEKDFNDTENGIQRDEQLELDTKTILDQATALAEEQKRTYEIALKSYEDAEAKRQAAADVSEQYIATLEQDAELKAEQSVQLAIAQRRYEKTVAHEKLMKKYQYYKNEVE
jgi:hypothetical protein